MTPDSEYSRLLEPTMGPTDWMMTRAERMVVEGVLAQLRPSLAIELGTAHGGSLRRIAHYSDEVHSFDLVAPAQGVPTNVTIHEGDYHYLLPTFLRDLESDGRLVDFVLVDGDHSPNGVRQDLTDLLGSTANRRTVILLHDMMNEFTREAVESLRLDRHPSVSYIDLDFCTNNRPVPAWKERWAGLGLVITGEAPYFGEPSQASPTRDIGRRRRLLRPLRRTRQRVRTLIGRARQRRLASAQE